MAHQTNVTQVGKNFSQDAEASQMVQDPVCGMAMKRRDSRAVLFQEDHAVHFCSRECRDSFLRARKEPKPKAA